MYFEDERTEIVGESVVYTRTSYGLGARAIDYIEKKVGSGATTVGFPVYDSHGNMVMTLSRSGSSWADGLHRSFDVWGSVRWNPSCSSDVKQRYCANLGHVEDDESGLIYMRARYYEPWTGRIVSEDSAMDGGNWYSYCDNSSTNKVDSSGESPNWPRIFGAFFTIGGLNFLLDAIYFAQLPPTLTYLTAASQSAMWALIWIGIGSAFSGGMDDMTNGILAIGSAFLGFVLNTVVSDYLAQIEMMGTNASIGTQSAARLAVTVAYAYSLLLTGYIVGINVADPWL